MPRGAESRLAFRGAKTSVMGTGLSRLLCHIVQPDTIQRPDEPLKVHSGNTFHTPAPRERVDCDEANAGLPS